MRFAAFVVVVVFSEVHSQQQCSDSLGTCSGSRASLMQVKSLSQKLQASTGRGTSNRAQTLAGFQKYTQELVDTYLEDPPVTGGLINGSSEPADANKVQHNNPVSKEVIAAIGIISEYLDQLYIDLQLFHEQDKNAAEFCANVPKRCRAANFNASVEQAIDNVLSHVEYLKTKHQDCRQDLASECADAVCPDYHGYRKSNSKALLPGCAKQGHLRGQDASLGSADLADFELCLQPTKEGWLDPLYGKYTDCKNQAFDEQTQSNTCKEEQGAFEDASCHSFTWIDIHCNNHAKCLEHGNNQCELGSTTGTADCAQIEQNWKARQSDNVTAERIRCLLKVLVSMDGDKGELLSRCHDAQYEEVKAFWVIPCAVDTSDIPPKCKTESSRPCSEEWMQTEYCSSDQCLKLRPADSEEDNCYQGGLDTCSVCGVDQSLDFEHAHVKTGFSEDAV